MDPLQLLAVSGSLRSGSYNRALLEAAATCAPPGIEISHGDLRGIPVFDEDREAIDGGGADVERFRAQVAAADAVLWSTPEYNQSIPGGLKNAIDWLSRPAPGQVLDGKPVAVVGVTSGPWGTRYAQQVLRHVLTATGCIVMGAPMLFVRHAAEVFDGDRLVDDAVGGQVQAVVTSLAAWTRAVTPRAAEAS